MRISKGSLLVPTLDHVRGGLYKREGDLVPVVRIKAETDGPVGDIRILMILSEFTRSPIETNADDDGMVTEYYIDVVSPDQFAQNGLVLAALVKGADRG